MATGPNMFAMLATSASGATTTPTITTIDELIASHGAILAKETADKATVAVLLEESRGTLRDPLFKWAAAGFPANYIIKEFTITPPPVCSDGVTRSVVDYFQYCLGVTLGNLLPSLQSLVNGMIFSYSFSGNSLRIHVTKN
jgi:hypothetical protein